MSLKSFFQHLLQVFEGKGGQTAIKLTLAVVSTTLQTVLKQVNKPGAAASVLAVATKIANSDLVIQKYLTDMKAGAPVTFEQDIKDALSAAVDVLPTVLALAGIKNTALDAEIEYAVGEANTIAQEL